MMQLGTGVGTSFHPFLIYVISVVIFLVNSPTSNVLSHLEYGGI